MEVVRSTITGNRVANGKQGGGLFLAAGSTTTLEHTIVAGNLRGPAPGGTPNDIQGPGALTATYNLIGDPARARAELGWSPSVTFNGLITMMVDADLARHQR